MTNHQRKRRIVTCQGSIQLVTALSVLRYREQEQQHLNLTYENYLVIYDLFAPQGQIEDFAAFIKKMAATILDWRAITYINAQQLEDISHQSNSTSPAKIFQMVYTHVGIDLADEIYLCRNWQFGNSLLINAYRSAEKICYGDSIGIYFSSTSKAFFAPTIETPKSSSLIFNWLRSWKSRFRALLEALKEKLQLKTVLATIEFDLGYFVLPDILGELPPMPTVTIKPTFIRETFEQLRGLVDPNYITSCQDKITHASIVILLTSNLSEASRMSLDNEITAYRELLLSDGIKKDTVLVIKPHPRDDITKIGKLKHALDDLFAEILVLIEPELFYIPFEVFFLEAFFTKNLAKNNIRVFAVSSACLSFKLLFDVPSIVGFGTEITTTFFHENYVTGRLEHEQDLRAALENITLSEIATTSSSKS